MTNQRLDALAREYAEKKWVVAQQSVSKDGFKAGYLAAQAEAEKLAKALDRISGLSCTDGRTALDVLLIYNTARSALAEYRKDEK